jgi:hypothetical protein
MLPIQKRLPGTPKALLLAKLQLLIEQKKDEELSQKPL